MSEENRQNSNSSVYHAREELESFENDLLNYNRYLVQKFLAEFKKQNLPATRNARILDFGAGIGTLAEIWNEYEPASKPICLEIDETQRRAIIDKGFSAIGSLSEISEKLDFIYTSNVIEHIENDLQTLEHLNNALFENSSIVIYVPAFQVLFSDLDRKAGHFRRYSKKDLREKLVKSGFTIENICYVDSIGFFAGLAIRILGWRKVGNLGNSKSLRFYDKSIFPISKFLDLLGFKYLFGKNLYVVARKTDEN
jgi:SAM-dependent methyltransferase